MKVTGVMLKSALAAWNLRLEATAQQFTDSLSRFEGETKKTPAEVVKTMNDCEDAIARLQVAQAQYNLSVTVKVGTGESGKVMSLTEAVKRIGGAGRIQKFWRTASKEERHPYHVRSTTDVPAIRTISVDEAVEHAVLATGYLESLRGAIARGNQTEKDFDLDPKLF